jgi:hypothetical protein
MSVEPTSKERSQQIDPDAVTDAELERLRSRVKRLGRLDALLDLSGLPFLFALVLSALCGLTGMDFFAVSTVFCAVTCGELYWSGRLGAAEADEIARLGDVRLVGCLVECLAQPSPFTARRNRFVRAALAPVLARLRPTDADLLDARQRRRLRDYLKWRIREDRNNDRAVRRRPNDRRRAESRASHADFVVAVLHALGQVSDHEAARPARGILKLREQSPDGNRMREAARECLALLEEHAAAARSAGTLLRASEAPAEEPGELLRPAADEISSSQDLLRPSDSPPA